MQHIDMLNDDTRLCVLTQVPSPIERLSFALTCGAHLTFFHRNKRPVRLIDLLGLLIQQGLNYNPAAFPLNELQDSHIEKFIRIMSHPFTLREDKFTFNRWVASDEMQANQQLVVWRLIMFCHLTIYGVNLRHPEMNHAFVTSENLHVIKELFSPVFFNYCYGALPDYHIKGILKIIPAKDGIHLHQALAAVQQMVPQGPADRLFLESFDKMYGSNASAFLQLSVDDCEALSGLMICYGK